MQSDSFKGVMSLFATGVTVVTTRGKGGAPYGVTVSSFTSVSLEPQLILICLDNRISGLEHFGRNHSFAVNILGQSQEPVSNYFATPGTDRSEKCGHYRFAKDQTPLLRESLAVMICELVETYPGGDHTILLGEVRDVSLGRHFNRQGPLLYYRGRYGRLDESVSEAWISERS